MNEFEKKNKELLEEVEKLNRQVKILKARKKYGLVWEEEKEPEQIVLDCQYKIPILKEVKTKEVITDKEKPMNILIEGDNYHALSVLNYTHKEKIDVIYIDPPYNTGKKHEWKYNDHYIDENDEYKHSKWLNFMSIRLELSRNLLKPQGIIFLSIDNNEIAQLKLLCDEIFGEENFIETFSWVKTSTPPGLSNKTRKTNEYVLCYERQKGTYKYFGEELDGGDQPLLNRGNKRRDLIFPKEKLFFKLENCHLKKGTYGRVELKTDIDIKSGFANKDVIINAEYKWTQDTFNEEVEKGTTFIAKSKDLSIRFIRQENGGYKSPNNYIREEIINPLVNKKESEVGTNETASTELLDLFHKKVFDNPKPISLIKYLAKFNTSKDITVLDFFAGTGTTGHAILDLNKDDNGNRKFILCTNNEDNNGDGLKIATDICYPRMEKAIKGYKNIKDEKVEGLGGNIHYFKTELLDVEHISHVSDEQKIKLTYQAGEMIALRENAFEEVEKDEWWQIFKDRTKYTAIYFKEDKRKLNELVKKLSKLKEKVVLYIFSWGKNEYKNEFTEYKNIKVEDIPEPIIEVYKEVNRLS